MTRPRWCAGWRGGWALALALGLVLAASACTRPSAWEQAGARAVEGGGDLSPLLDGARSRSGRRWTGAVTAVSARRGEVPNAGLQLPAVSPDGQWVAYLTADAQADPATLPGPDALVSGRGLEAVGLALRAVGEAEDIPSPRPVARGGVCWPVWSADGSTLFFVEYGPRLGCTLGAYDLQHGTTRRQGVGLRHMMMPAPAPGGGRLAVVAYGERPDDALVFVVDLAAGTAEPGPPPVGSGGQVQPRWITDDTLLFLELDPDGGPASLRRWTVGDRVSHLVRDIPGAPGSVFDAPLLAAGIAQPLAPDRSRLALFMPAGAHTRLLPLGGGEPLALAAGTHGGAWWDGRWWVAAGSAGVELVSALSADPAAPDRLRLLPGRWAPLWADRGQQSVLLVGPGETPGAFTLVQLWLVVNGE